MATSVRNFTYHRIIRKMIVAFGNIFNNINMSRYDQQGVETEHFLVPIVYGGKEKYVNRLEGDPDFDKKTQVTLPIISYEMTGMTYDSSRKLNTNQKIQFAGGAPGVSLAVYNPVPFDFHFKLHAYVRNIEDGAQLMEKIIPYFTPDYTMNVNLIPEMGLVKQIPVTLKDVVQEVDYEGDSTTPVRTVIWSLDFTVKGYLFGPVNQPKIITTSITNILDDVSLVDRNAVFIVDGVGSLGNYIVGEAVYQGYSYQTASATGDVKSWNPTTKELVLENMVGHFITGTKIVGLDSNATWIPNSIASTSALLAKAVVTPNPSDVVMPNNYTYTTVISEVPNII